ncbi:MAG: hypothetical protein MJ188_03900 [Treponema sp.]|nr:hypothetical protein [Treponema sp.]
MISLPLFGKDSSPHRTSLIISLIASSVLWIFFGISSVFIKINPKQPVYKTVQIVLDSTPMEEVSEVEETAIEEEIEVVEATGVLEEAEVLEKVDVVEAKDVFAESDSVAFEERAQEVEQTEVKTVEKNVEKSVPPVVEKIAVEQKTEPVSKPVVEQKSADVVPEKTLMVPEEAVPAKEPYNPEIVKTAEELWNEQMAAKKNQKKEIDWDAMFDSEEDSPVTEDSNRSAKKVQTESSSSGLAAEKAKEENQTEAGKNGISTSEEISPSSETSKALDKIGQTEQISKSTNNKSEEPIKDAAKNGRSSTEGAEVNWEKGANRNVLSPSVLEITLSEKAAVTIDTGSVEVKITFIVGADGKIQRSSIDITPPVLNSIVKEEIYDQISSWTFEESSTSASGSFVYTIKKR